MVKVRFHGALKDEIGLDHVDVNITQLAEALSRLPDNIKAVLEKYEKYLIVLVNGRRTYDLNISLGNDSVVDIMLPLGGG